MSNNIIMNQITKEIIKTFLGLSVFKRPKISFYFGPIVLGAPIFYPRKINKNNRFVYLKWFGVKVVPLGWKTKWYENDIRFEWNPQFHLVILKRQLVISLYHKETDYWEYLILYTRLKGSPQERVDQILKEIYYKGKVGYDLIKDTRHLIFKRKYNGLH